MVAPFYLERNMKKLLAHDPKKGKQTYIHSEGDQNYITTKFNVDPIISNAKSEAADWRPKSMIGNTQKHLQKVADIPAPIYYELINKFGQPRDNPKAWKRWLNDYDNRFFRTTGGTI